MYLYSRLLGFRALGLNFDQRDRDWVYLSTFMYILTDLKTHQHAPSTYMYTQGGQQHSHHTSHTFTKTTAALTSLAK